MKFRKSSHTIKYRITRAVFLVGYITCLVVLAVEAATPGKQSAAKSNVVGATIESILNDINGDTAKEIMPLSCAISETKYEYYVGDKHQVNVITNPSDATYQSYIYQSSNVNVATVNEFGEISFLKAGNTIITAINTKVETVRASANYICKNIPVESFTSSINAPKKDDIYQLEVASSYVVSNKFVPENATIKDVTYEYNVDDGYIQMVDDTIKVLKDSNGVSFDLTVKCGELSNTLKLVSYVPEVIEEDYPIVGFKVSNVTKYVDQTSAFTPSVTYNPTNTSDKYRGYTLSSSDESIAKISGKQILPQGNIGEAIITVTSTYNPLIQASFTFKVNDRPTLTSASISKYVAKMYVGNSQRLTTQISPSNALTTKSFTSSNTSVATINSSGNVKAKAVGTTTITFTVTDTIHNVVKSDQVVIEVIEKPVLIVTDIEVSPLQGENPIIYSDEEVDLSKYYKISKYIGNESTTKKDYSFYVDTSTYPGTLLSDNKTFIPNMVGEVVATLVYYNEQNDILTKDVNFTVISRFEILDKDNVSKSSYQIDVGTSLDFVINLPNVLEGHNYNQKYNISINNTDIFDLAYDDKNIFIFAKKPGTVSLEIVPIISINEVNVEISKAKIIISITAVDVYTTTLGVEFYDKDHNLLEVDTNNTVLLFINQELNTVFTIDEKTTRSDISVTSDSELIEIKNNKVIPKKIGDASIEIKELYSNISYTYNLRIRNFVKIDENASFKITGFFEYYVKDGVNYLEIVNGNTAVIRYNFDSKSTYKNTTYKVDKEDVAVVGKDGTITPKHVGETTLTMSVVDSLSSHVTSVVKIKVLRRNFVQNVEEFMYQIRKLVGHFGAFAVLGIFSTITYFMFFRKKLFPLGVAINISTGFGYAAFTEWIQTLTPGRAGLFSDVMIDFYGLLLSSVAITTVILIVALIIYLVRLKKNKDLKNNNNDKIENTDEKNDINSKKDIVEEMIDVIAEDKNEL